MTSYDAERGLGTIRDEAGEHLFHCTAIADRTRSIDEGAVVSFVVVAGLGGRYEARAVTKSELSGVVAPSR